MKKQTTIMILAFLLLACLRPESSQCQMHVEAGPVYAELKEIGSAVLQGPSVLGLEGYFVWGGSVARGLDGKYHMLFSLWESGTDRDDFATSWVLESKIGYAVSKFPDRDFKFKKIILDGARHGGRQDAWDAQMVHNPHVKKFGDSYYLYYIGGRDAGEAAAPGLDARTRVQQSLQIGVIRFDSFEELVNGNFQRPDKPLLSPRTRVKTNKVLNPSPAGTVAKPDNLVVVNPSVAFNPNSGEYLLFFKGNLYEPGWKGVHGVAIGPTPLGPFVAKDEFIFDVRMPDGSMASTEDPYVWYSTDHKRFFSIVKDFSGQLTRNGANSMALLHSRDGINWNLSDPPLFKNREIRLVNGQTIELNRLERPQLLLTEGGIPLFLYCAASVADLRGKKDGASFNVQLPLLIKTAK